MYSRRLLLKISMAVLALILATPALTQQVFPSKPIKILVPYAAGGITDILARLLAQQMEASLGQRVLVDNKPGAGGTLGTDLVAKAPADGYTILLGALSPLVISKIAADKLPYDPVKDFMPISQIASAPLVLVVHPSVPANSAKELVDLLRAKPDSLSYSSAGAGTPSHLSGELFKKHMDLRVTHIPYKGTGASLTDLVAGQVQMTFDSPAALLPFIKTGKLRPLAVASNARSPLLPEVPTFAEVGFSGLVVNGWYGLLVPAQTPRDVVDKLRAATAEAVKHKEVSAKIIDMGAVPVTGSSKEFSDLMVTEYTRWLPVVKTLNLTLN